MLDAVERVGKITRGSSEDKIVHRYFDTVLFVVGKGKKHVTWKKVKRPIRQTKRAKTPSTIFPKDKKKIVVTHNFLADYSLTYGC